MSVKRTAIAAMTMQSSMTREGVSHVGKRMSQVYTYCMESQEQIRTVNFSESDIARVKTELDANPEAKAEGAPTQEAVRQALVAVLPQPVPATAVAAAPSAVAENAGTQQRIDALLKIAQEDGIDAAHARAAADEPYVLDAFHDALAGALHEELQRRGQL